MNVLVTGADGFIGRYVCNVLDEQQISYFKGTRNCFDINNVPQMKDFLLNNNITHIIHLAARADSSDLVEVFNSNITGLYKLLLATKETGVKHFTFASTNNVYGENHEDVIREDIICAPAISNIYALSKYTGELLVKDMLNETNVDWTSLRLSDVYGPGQKYGNLIKAIVNAVREENPVKLYGDGLRTRDFIFVDDVARGIVFSCVNGLKGIYNLSTGIGTSVRELVDYAVDISAGKCTVEHINVEKEDDSRIVLNPEKINSVGFYAKTLVKDGLKKCVEE